MYQMANATCVRILIIYCPITLGGTHTAEERHISSSMRHIYSWRLDGIAHYVGESERASERDRGREGGREEERERT